MDFRIHDGASIHGECRWHEGASEGTVRRRTAPIMINGMYSVKWNITQICQTVVMEPSDIF